jgi:hypothetical protein
MDIYKSPTGRLNKDPSGYNSYIPNPLPPKITWNDELVLALCSYVGWENTLAFRRIL